MKKNALPIISVFCCIALTVSILVTLKNSCELRGLLESSIKAQLMSISQAAEEIVSEYNVSGYNSNEDIKADAARYGQMLSRVRTLAADTGATYIYGLKFVNNEVVFFLDTDEENTDVFVPYEIGDIHRDAFAGRSGAGINNLVDEYGSFHTGAVPLYAEGKVAAILAVDIADSLVKESFDAANRNIIILVIAQVIVFGFMLVFIMYLMRRIRAMQAELTRMAHYDPVTGMPNRQYLFEYLPELMKSGKKLCYALIFIDLDNFKLVNDSAGHDAGDALLRSIGEFLQKRPAAAKAFRPSAGLLNVSARVGGDEFVQVVPGIENEEQARKFVDDMLHDFHEEATNRHIQEYAVGMSIGVALYPYHSENYNVLIKYADIAMYHAKKNGKNRCVIYSENLAPKEEK